VPSPSTGTGSAHGRRRAMPPKRDCRLLCSSAACGVGCFFSAARDWLQRCPAACSAHDRRRPSTHRSGQVRAHRGNDEKIYCRRFEVEMRGDGAGRSVSA